MPEIKVGDRIRPTTMRRNVPSRLWSLEKASDQASKEAKVRPGRTRELRRRGPDCFRVSKSGDRTNTHNDQLSRLFVWWRDSQSELSSTPAPVRRPLLLKHRGPVPSHPQPVPCGKGSPKKSLEFRTAAQAVPRAQRALSWARSRLDSQPALCGTPQRL